MNTNLHDTIKHIASLSEQAATEAAVAAINALAYTDAQREYALDMLTQPSFWRNINIQGADGDVKWTAPRLWLARDVTVTHDGEEYRFGDYFPINSDPKAALPTEWTILTPAPVGRGPRLEELPLLELANRKADHGSFGPLHKISTDNGKVSFYSLNGYGLPYCQRDFVWSHDQCSKFINSLMCGLPFGSLCITETSVLPSEVAEHFGHLAGAQHALSNMIIDGQQRMTALVLFFHDRVSWSGHVFSEFKAAQDILCSDELTVYKVAADGKQVLKEDGTPDIDWEATEEKHKPYRWLAEQYERMENIVLPVVMLDIRVWSEAAVYDIYTALSAGGTAHTAAETAANAVASALAAGLLRVDKSGAVLLYNEDGAVLAELDMENENIAELAYSLCPAGIPEEDDPYSAGGQDESSNAALFGAEEAEGA